MAKKTKVQQQPPESIKKDYWTPEDRFRFFGQMAALGVVRLTVDFNGSGDDGAIESGTGWDEEGKKVSLPKEALDLIDSFAENYCQDMGHDWVQNEGGFGTLTFMVKESRLDVDYHQRIEETLDYTFKLEL